MTVFVHFHLKKFRHGIFPLIPEELSFAAWAFWGYLPVSLCLHFCCKRGRLSFLSHRANCVQTRDHDWKLHQSPFETVIQFLPTESIIPLSFLRWLVSPFVTLGYCSSSPLFRSGLWSFASSLSWSHMTSYWCLQSGTARLFIVSNIFLFTQSQYSRKLNRILQSDL